MLCRKTGIYTASFLLLFALFCLRAAEADECRRIDKLVLNDGGRIRLFVGSEAPFLGIVEGTAQRVPRKPHLPTDVGQNVVELDISTRVLYAKTSARHIAISGARGVNISGISAACWGTFPSPALHVDRDCVVSLSGTARSEAVIRISPLARVTIDARKLSTPELRIVGNPSTVVRRGKNTNVHFYLDRSEPSIRVSGEGESTSESAPAAEKKENVPAETPAAENPADATAE